MKMEYILLNKPRRVSKGTIRLVFQWVWVDVWSLASGTWTVLIKASQKHFKNYWSGKVATIGFRECKDYDEMIKLCKEIRDVLEIPLEHFFLRGSPKNDTWLRDRIAGLFKSQ